MSSSLTDSTKNYKLYDISFVRENLSAIADAALQTSGVVSSVLNGVEWQGGHHKHDPNQCPNSTWLYGYYNFFSARVKDVVIYDLFSEVKTCIRDFIGMEERAWTQCWVNSHLEGGLLHKHHHDYPIHWYLSIYPQNTETVFYKGDNEIYRVKNEPGKLYIGPGDRLHEVVKSGEFDNMPRITLAGNVLRPSDKHRDTTLSFIPI
ncbi:hypothetical protein Syn7803US114_18 [Synechococcus phage ACG-2014d]|uniref:Uncharacterized protein n=1 Tax=Synechococcus phage ACG-2014d TaxID=1493509 RepID=A0A0E3FFT6_9CAUD|nr:hypothetical protein Syn7803US114_18 [Synechococcus phage ACG-2014d]